MAQERIRRPTSIELFNALQSPDRHQKKKKISIMLGTIGENESQLNRFCLEFYLLWRKSV